MCTQRWLWIRCKGRRLIGPGDATEPCQNPAPQMVPTDPPCADGPIIPCPIWLAIDPVAVKGSASCVIFGKEWVEKKGIKECKTCVEQTKHQARVEQIRHVGATHGNGDLPDYRTAHCVHGADESCFRCTKTFPADYLVHGEEDAVNEEEAVSQKEEED